MKNKQTAVEWLITELSKNRVSNCSVMEQIEREEFIWGKAKQMEKEQIEDAFDEGNPNGFILKDGEQYYNETYGK